MTRWPQCIRLTGLQRSCTTASLVLKGYYRLDDCSLLQRFNGMVEVLIRIYLGDLVYGELARLVQLDELRDVDRWIRVPFA